MTLKAKNAQVWNIIRKLISLILLLSDFLDQSPTWNLAYLFLMHSVYLDVNLATKHFLFLNTILFGILYISIHINVQWFESFCFTGILVHRLLYKRKSFNLTELWHSFFFQWIIHLKKNELYFQTCQQERQSSFWNNFRFDEKYEFLC